MRYIHTFENRGRNPAKLSRRAENNLKKLEAEFLILFEQYLWCELVLRPENMDKIERMAFDMLGEQTLREIECIERQISIYDPIDIYFESAEMVPF